MSVSQSSKGLIGVCVTMMVLDTVIVGLRVWVRFWYLRSTKAWGMDDTLTVLGFTPYFASCVFVILSAHYGLGLRDDRLTDLLMLRASEYFTYWQLSYAIAIGFVKSSICVALLRLTNERCYRIPLWLVTLSAAVVGVSGVITTLTLCHPIAANWNKGLGTCSAADIVLKLVYMINVMAIFTDLVCAILPWFILRKLQMPKRTKYSILFVPSIGILASIGSVMRIPYTSAYLVKEDILCEQFAHCLSCPRYGAGPARVQLTNH
ncbi:hypothetical protein PG988_011434 [Apiospora saccharicola]